MLNVSAATFLCPYRSAPERKQRKTVGWCCVAKSLVTSSLTEISRIIAVSRMQTAGSESGRANLSETNFLVFTRVLSNLRLSHHLCNHLGSAVLKSQQWLLYWHMAVALLLFRKETCSLGLVTTIGYYYTQSSRLGKNLWSQWGRGYDKKEFLLGTIYKGKPPPNPTPISEMISALSKLETVISDSQSSHIYRNQISFFPTLYKVVITIRICVF